MPEFDGELDAALLAFARGTKPARDAADALLEEYPERSEARAVAALGRIGAGDLAAARAVVLAEDGPSLAARASLTVQEGRLDEGTRLAERALALAPDNAIVVSVAGGIVGAYDPERGLVLARRSVELRPHDPSSYGRLVAALAAVDDREAIVHLLDDPPAAFAGTAPHTRLRATEFQRTGDLVAAQAATRELVAQTPDGAGAWALLAILLNKDDQRVDADTAALHALDLNPRQPEALLVLARSAEARGDTTEAKRLWEERRLASPLAEAMRPIHDIREFHRQGKRTELLAALARFDELPPFALPWALRLRIRFLTIQGDDEALRRAVEAAPFDDDWTAAGRAELLLREFRYAEARALLEPRWAERRPIMLAPYLVRALGGDDPESARRLADDLTASPPGNVLDAFSTLMAMSKTKVMQDRLWPYLNEIERKYPSSQPIREFKASVLLRMGRFDQAARLGGTLDEPRRRRFRTKELRTMTKAIAKALWRRAKTRWVGKKT